MRYRILANALCVLGLAVALSTPVLAAAKASPSPAAHPVSAKPGKGPHVADKGKSKPITVKNLPGKPVGYQVSINSADEHELQLLPFVGPQVAKRIIAARPFKKIDDLQKVKGIAAIYMSAIRPHVKL
jgi:DNA uptake protein ComE-like DNA-binding protein